MPVPPTDRLLRLFVALPLPPVCREELARLPIAGVPGARLGDPAGFHLTLRFIGDVDSPTADVIRGRLAAIDAPTLDLRAAGVGCFPNTGRCRVLWAGFTGDIDRLDRLHARIGAALADLPAHDVRALFHPHVTLARFRDPPPAPAVAAWIERHREFVGTQFTVAECILYSSRLERRGAIHTPQFILRLQVGTPES